MPEVDGPDSADEAAALRAADSAETAALRLAGIPVKAKPMLNGGCWSSPELDTAEENDLEIWNQILFALSPHASGKIICTNYEFLGHSSGMETGEKSSLG